MIHLDVSEISFGFPIQAPNARPVLVNFSFYPLLTTVISPQHQQGHSVLHHLPPSRLIILLQLFPPLRIPAQQEAGHAPAKEDRERQDPDRQHADGH